MKVWAILECYDYAGANESTVSVWSSEQRADAEIVRRKAVNLGQPDEYQVVELEVDKVRDVPPSGAPSEISGEFSDTMSQALVPSIYDLKLEPYWGDDEPA
jgi:hypothetical protein